MVGNTLKIKFSQVVRTKGIKERRKHAMHECVKSTTHLSGNLTCGTISLSTLSMVVATCVLSDCPSVCRRNVKERDKRFFEEKKRHDKNKERQSEREGKKRAT